MRSMRSRLATTILVGILVLACAPAPSAAPITAPPPSGRPPLPSLVTTPSARSITTAPGTWTAAASMAEFHDFHTATLLADGRVLVVGGSSNPDAQATAELYDPSSGSWTATGSMAETRQNGHTATLLRDGRVLVVGDDHTRSAELYDPSSGRWTAAASTLVAPNGTATLLLDGTVLVVSGNDVQLYDPWGWPSPAQVTLPVGGSAREVGRSLQMTPGPAGGLYVLISTERRSVVALLDSSGKPRPGWPIALEDTWCHLPAPAADGSIHLVCGFYGGVGGDAFAFAPDGRAIAGWPVELPPSESFTAPRMVGGDLYVVTSDPNDNVGLRLVAVAPDGALDWGARYEAPNRYDRRVQLGPDGTGYVLEFPDGATGETKITAFDLDGVRQGWLATVKGRPSGLGFGPDGRIYVTEGQQDQRTSRILVFDHGGRLLPIGSEALPVAPTSEYGGAGPFDGPPPPVVADDGTTFLVSEESGTTVYALDATGRVTAGWPYRDTVGLQWSYVAPGETGSNSWRMAPAVGPGNVLYLLHPPRAASVGGSIVAVGLDGRVRPGWPVELKRPGAEFWSVVVGFDGTVYALAVEPETGDTSSASILAIAPDSTLLWRTTIVDP